MKKFISGLIIGVMLSITVVYAAASLTAVPVTFPAGINTTLTINRTDSLDNYKAEVTIKEVIRGGQNREFDSL